MALLPKEYGPFKSGIKVDKEKFSNFTIYQFRAELKEFYEDNIEPMKKQAEENEGVILSYKRRQGGAVWWLSLPSKAVFTKSSDTAAGMAMERGAMFMDSLLVTELGLLAEVAAFQPIGHQ